MRTTQNKRLIIIDLEEKDIIGGNFEIIENNKKEESIIKSSWNEGFSIGCIDREDLLKEINDIIESEVK